MIYDIRSKYFQAFLSTKAALLTYQQKQANVPARATQSVKPQATSA